MLELARLLGLDKSSTTGLVGRAERRGLVQRASSATDRRSVQVGLTLEGRALVSAAAARFGAEATDLLAPPSAGGPRIPVRTDQPLLAAHAASQGIDLLGTTGG